MSKFRGDNNFRKTQMHHAVCDKCGRDCEVPFKPTGGKPIFCNNCFDGKSDGGKRYPKRDFGDRQSRRKEMFSATCDECGKKCEVPFRPTSGKPLYCDNCFGSKKDKGDNNKGSSQNYDKKFEMLENKIDQIINLLSVSDTKETKKNEKKTDKKVAKIVKDKKTTPKKKIIKKKATKKKSTKKKITKKKK